MIILDFKWSIFLIKKKCVIINFFKKENRKILTGTSRKKSFADFFKDTSKTKLSASLLSGIICALGGSNIIRSHEVKHLREELEKLGIYER